MTSASIAAVIPAAGASRRLGRPKQLVERAGKSLVVRATESAVAAGCRPVVVVLGANAEAIAPLLAPTGATVVHHPGWKQGMGGSIAAGVRRLPEGAETPAGLLVLPCDLPAVGVRELGRLLRTFERSGGQAVAAAYDGVLGAPAVFPAARIAELSELEGDVGARHLLRGLAAVIPVPMPAAARDVDDPQQAADEGLEPV